MINEIKFDFFLKFKLIIDYENIVTTIDDISNSNKRIAFLVFENSHKEQLIRMNQFVNRVKIKNALDALSFVRIRTSPILCDMHSSLFFGDYCLEVIPKENIKYDMTFGNMTYYNKYISESTLLPLKKNVSVKYKSYPILEYRNYFIIKRLIMSVYGNLYESEEHVNERGEIFMESRRIIDKINNLGRNIYFILPS